jgi:hypothetical protein
LGHLPVTEAGGFPSAEVLFADGLVFEVLFENRLDFGHGVKPKKNGFIRFAVVESTVKLVAELAWEAGNFAGAFHGRSQFKV